MADELERRVRTLEEELNGERHVSRYAIDQARRGTEAFLALRSEVAALRADIAGTTARVDAVGENMTIVNAALVRHGRALDVLMQDVREMRGAQIEVNARLEEMNGGLEGTNARLDRMQEEANARFDRMQEEANVRFDRLETAITAILAAVAPQAPA
jgi:chromosome segregation ATPase